MQSLPDHRRLIILLVSRTTPKMGRAQVDEDNLSCTMADIEFSHPEHGQEPFDCRHSNERGYEMKKKSRSTSPGTVDKIIKNPYTDEPEKVQISVDGADDLYREIRVENAFPNKEGEIVKLKVGDDVDVIVEADTKDTVL